MATKTQAIKAFLTDFTISDLAALYDYDMEVQVNVAQDNGEPITQKSGFTGRMWRGYTDGIQTWKPFRIPWNAASEPEYTDSNLNWSLKDHAEGIGMTGWCWKEAVSKWVGFDFDAISNHADGLTVAELQAVKDEAYKIPWITIRKSTSGKGLHLYVLLDDIPTKNHTEHSALARAILGKMTAATGFEFSGKVDVFGGNMWVWHRKMRGTDGLKLIKQGDILRDIPVNWMDHVPVIKGRRRRNLPSFVEEENVSTFECLTGQYPHVKLDEGHKKLLDYLEENQCQWWYDPDNHLLVCHTADLKRAHHDLNFRGIFDTKATGKDKPDHNVFCYPEEHPSGSWVVRRFTQGIDEAPTWSQDSAGYTRCYLNKEPTLQAVAGAFHGIEDEKGNYFFNEAETAATAVEKLGANLNLPNWAGNRKAIIKSHKDGRRIIVEISKESSDNPAQMVGWKEDKGWWKRIFNARLSAPDTTEVQNYDNLVRHLVTHKGDDAGWVLKAGNQWHSEPLTHLKIALKSFGLQDSEINKALGKCVMESWTLVNKPFEDEFPGNREWNRDAVQLKYLPQQNEPFIHPNWDKLLAHCGDGLDEGVKNNGWCQANGVLTGADYLRLWIASVFQAPKEHLPYLFLYSPEQQTGKTTLHEAIKLLITSSGYMDVKAALINSAGFNEEMKNAVICAVDELDLRQNKFAYNRMKDWITGEEILIHPKGKTPYMVRNVAHFIHTGNDPNECPVPSEDSRIMVIRVPPLDPLEMVPKDELFVLLEKEAEAFLGTLFSIEIPPCRDRLNIPVVETDEKGHSQKLNRSSLEEFIDECCFLAPGETIKYNDFWLRFQDWLDPNEVASWSKIRMGRSLPSKHPKGRVASDGGQFYVANLSFIKPDTLGSSYLVLKKDQLVLEG